MGFFKDMKGVPAHEPAPVTPPAAKPPIDVELTNLITPPTPRKAREGRITATQWKAAELHWRECRSFTEVAERLGCTASNVARRAAREDWPARLGRDSATDLRQSQAAIVARVTEQLERLDTSDKQALADAIRADHRRIGRELIEMGREALERCPVDRAADALRLIELGLKTEADSIADSNSGAASLTLTLRQQLDKFSVQKPKVTVSPTLPPQIEETGGEP